MPENSDGQAILIPITGKQIGIAIVTILTAISAFPVANHFTPSVRNDPFTGTQGSELEDRIEVLELQQALTTKEQSDCQDRQDTFGIVLKEHLKYSQGKVEKITDQFATLKAQRQSDYQLIKDCMRRTGAE